MFIERVKIYELSKVEYSYNRVRKSKVERVQHIWGMKRISV